MIEKIIAILVLITLCFLVITAFIRVIYYFKRHGGNTKNGTATKNIEGRST